MSLTLKKLRVGPVEGTFVVDTFCMVCYGIVAGLGVIWLVAMVFAIIS